MNVLNTFEGHALSGFVLYHGDEYIGCFDDIHMAGKVADMLTIGRERERAFVITPVYSDDWHYDNQRAHIWDGAKFRKITPADAFPFPR